VITAAEILVYHNEIEMWTGLLRHKSADIRLRTLSYLTDGRDGKPKLWKYLADFYTSTRPIVTRSWPHCHRKSFRN